MKRLIRVSCCVFCVLALTQLTAATELEVNHSVAGLLFNDDFESDTVGSDPAIGPGDTGDSWSSDPNAPEFFVADLLAATGPAPSAGQFLQVGNDGAVPGAAAGLFGQTFTTGTLTADFSFLIPSDNGSGADLNTSLLATFQNTTGDLGSAGAETWTHFATGFWMADEADLTLPGGVSNDDGVFGYFDGSWNIATAGGVPFTYTLDEWHDASIAYNLDSSSMNVTIDGTSLDDNIAQWLNAIGDAQGVLFRQNAGRNDPSLAYVGGVPLVPGDVNGDELVTIDDFNIILANFGMTNATLTDGDLTFDTVVDLFDFKEWKDHAPPGLIPEPSSLSLLLVAGGLWLGYSRRSRRQA